MAPQTPLLLVDNLFDTVNLYPAAALTTTSEVTGREGYRVADARRERSWWQTATSAANHNIKVDLGVGNTANVDSLWLDRGHNLAGQQVIVQYSDNGSSWTALATLTVPAAGVVGGDPTTGFSQTEEGACYALFAAAAAAHRYWLLNITPNMIPVIPGIIMGRRTQLLNFSRVRDEDSMTRTEIQETSRSGYLGTDKRYSWRTVTIDLAYIGSADYDATMRTLRRQLFELDQAAFVAMEYGTKPERGWLYRWDGTRYSAPLTRVYRATQITLREVGPLLR